MTHVRRESEAVRRRDFSKCRPNQYGASIINLPSGRVNAEGGIKPRRFRKKTSKSYENGPFFCFPTFVSASASALHTSSRTAGTADTPQWAASADSLSPSSHSPFQGRSPFHSYSNCCERFQSGASAWFQDPIGILRHPLLSRPGHGLSLIHISEPTRLLSISYAV